MKKNEFILVDLVCGAPQRRGKITVVGRSRAFVIFGTFLLWCGGYRLFSFLRLVVFAVEE